MVKKFTTELFKERARQIHGDKFDYSITVYEGALLKVKFICNTCGEIIIMIASNHINIRSSKGKACGCYNCFKKMHPILQSSTNDEFITKSKATHGDIYDYSNTKYIHSQHKVEIICSKHGIFIQRPSDHLDGAGCPSCSHSGFSKVSLDWLKIMSFVYNCNIITGLNNNEFKIQDIGKVDGFNYENNLVFEFHGDFWHGNPKIYNMNEVNNVSKKTFGELYNKTVMRDLKIIEKGYNLISIWEHDWNLKIKLNKEIINYKL